MSLWQKLKDVASNVTVPLVAGTVAFAGGIAVGPYAVLGGVVLFGVGFAVNLIWTNTAVNVVPDSKFENNRGRISKTIDNNHLRDDDQAIIKSILEKAGTSDDLSAQLLIEIIGKNEIENLEQLKGYIARLQNENTRTRLVTFLSGLVGTGLLGVGYFFGNINYGHSVTNNSTASNSADNQLLNVGPALQAGGFLFASFMQLRASRCLNENHQKSKVIKNALEQYVNSSEPITESSSRKLSKQ